MYPLNMKLVNGIGFAVANDEDEHQALTEAGYAPARVVATLANGADPSEADSSGRTVASVRAELDAAGIAYDKRSGLAKLVTLLPAA